MPKLFAIRRVAGSIQCFYQMPDSEKAGYLRVTEDCSRLIEHVRSGGAEDAWTVPTLIGALARVAGQDPLPQAFTLSFY